MPTLKDILEATQINTPTKVTTSFLSTAKGKLPVILSDRALEELKINLKTQVGPPKDSLKTLMEKIEEEIE